MAGILLDTLLAIMLACMLGYAYLLNKRLRALHADRAALEGLITGLAETSMRAEAGVAALRTAADQIGEQLQQKIERAHALREDVGYMLERGATLADRLEQAVRAGRGGGAAQQESSDEPRLKVPSRAERDLRRILEARRG